MSEGITPEELLSWARGEGASDIHLDPQPDGVRVRFRVDGVLREQEPLPAACWPRWLGRLKVLGALDLLDGLHPQDGVVRVEAADWRLAVLPGIQGSKVTLRLLDARPLAGLAGLGMEPATANVLRRLLDGTGLLPVVGPAGAGKTTTLYACLWESVQQGKLVVSLEDPVERILPGVVQMQIRPRAGLGFTEAVRAVLRHDPQVLAIGEVRDEDGARAVVRAALTGHLVLCTVHAANSLSAIERMLDLGADRAALTATMCGVVEQHLVRRLCRECGGSGVSGGEPCARCRGQGWQGRELLAVVKPALAPLPRVT